MIFHDTPVHGVVRLAIEMRRDERGFFARAFCADEFDMRGLETKFVQMNVSRSARRRTLRGMHYQLGASAEVKLVRCTAGAIYDVALDLRPDSPTFGQWFGTELTAENHEMLYIPRGCAHGFITLADESEVFYQVSAPYDQGAERGIYYQDPRFGIVWPLVPDVISSKDAANPWFDPQIHGIEALRGLT